MPPSGTRVVLQRLHPGIQRWILESPWSGLKPIQQAAIPVVLDGHDCVIEAPTAGGKTEAVLFPVLTRAAQKRAGAVQILYLAPLRALLNNLELRGEEYAEACGLEAFKWHGDVDQEAKLRRLTRPPALLMTTPESVEAILLRKADPAAFFADLDTVILDEAHNFAAGDRGGHLLALLERLEHLVGRSPQRIALSATVGNPEAMLRWLAGRRRTPGERVRVRVRASPGQRDFRVQLFTDRAPARKGLEETAKDRRIQTLQALLPRHRSLVFVRSRAGAEEIAKELADQNERSWGRPLRVQTHHSAVSKYYREEAEKLIRIASWSSEDRLDAIISTSTLELGIDIGELDRVFQMDALPSPSGFLQRVGRTGRRPGKPQFFRGLCTKLDDLVILTAAVNLGWKLESERLHLPRRAFHLLAHQLLCLALQSHGVTADGAWEVLSSAHCFSEIRRPEVDRLVEHMVAKEYVRPADGVLVTGDRTEREFLRAGWRRLFAVFDSAPLYEVVHRRKPVGTLDAGFVEALEVPFFFVLGGKLWKADEVHGKSRTVRAVRSRSGDPPKWSSFGGPGVPLETAQEAGRLLHGHEPLPDFLEPEGREGFELLVRDSSALGWHPGEIDLQATGAGSARLVTYAGDRINRTLARALEGRGIGRCAARYDEVELKKGPEDRADLEQVLGAVLDALGEGGSAVVESLERELQGTQPLWPFSPFARCLPDDLWAAALLEQTLDCEGLVRLLETTELRIRR